MGKAERQWRLSSRSFERRTTNLSSRRAGCERSGSTQQQSKGLFLFLRFLRPFTGKWKWFRRSNANTSLLKTERRKRSVCERARERERESGRKETTEAELEAIERSVLRKRGVSPFFKTEKGRKLKNVFGSFFPFAPF